MDDTTKKIAQALAVGAVKKVLMAVGAAAAAHGFATSGLSAEVYAGIALAIVSAGWSFWNDYGKAIVLAQLEMLKAKSLAQAAKMRQANLPPVTAEQIADQSPTLTPADVTKTVATMPVAVQNNVAKVVIIGALLGIFAFTGDARAQTPTPIKRPQITGDVVADTKANLGLGGSGGGLRSSSGSPLNNILGALDDVLLPDLQYALKLAQASDSKVTAPCFQAWIDIINKRKVALTNADGTAVELPNPRLFTDFEKAVELRNALQPDSSFSIACAPVILMVKLDILSFMGKVIGGGAGLAALVPGL